MGQVDDILGVIERSVGCTRAFALVRLLLVLRLDRVHTLQDAQPPEVRNRQLQLLDRLIASDERRGCSTFMLFKLFINDYNFDTEISVLIQIRMNILTRKLLFVTFFLSLPISNRLDSHKSNMFTNFE